VHVGTTGIQVVAADRACRAVADAVTAELRRRPGMSVDPRSPVRLDVFGCGQSWQLDLHSQVSTEGGTRRRMTLAGRGYGAASLRTEGRLHANLIATSRASAEDSWATDPLGFRGLRRRAARGLPSQVALDIVRQLDQAPREVSRRVYVRAPAGTRREFHNLAVAAEHFGDVDTAFYLAAAAHQERPTTRSASYLAELARRRLLALPAAP
jgi:hypothetical protein